MARSGKNRIDFELNFQKGDMTALESLKRELISVKKLASSADFGLNNAQINQAVTGITAIERALDQSFNTSLNTINVQKFNQSLVQSGFNLKTLQQNLSILGTEGNKAFLRLSAQLMQFNGAVKQSNGFVDKLAMSFLNTAKYVVLNRMINSTVASVQKAYYYVKDLDRSLNDIRIVTGKNSDEMSRFAEEANNAAKALAVTTEDYTKGSLLYYQQGLDDETVKTLTNITAMTSNVTGQSMENVSQELTAVWNGYQVANQAAKEGMNVYQEYVDKMAAVGATTASNLQELASAMSKVASAASSMGINFDDLTAQIATIVSVTRQAPESVGTALKTVYARLGDLKVDGVDEFGTKLGEVSAQLKVMGIDILDVNGDMRDMSSVMAEVAEKWDTWTSAQKQAAAIAMAGKRQYNNLVALFDNWDMYGEALETSMNAAGTLEKQQEIALDSLANKLDILKSTSEDLYDSLFDENTLKGFVTGLTKIIQSITTFTDAVGGLNTLLPLLGATAFRVFNQQIAQGLGTIITNLRNARAEKELLVQNEMAIRQMFSDSSLYNYTSNDAQGQARAEGLRQLVQTYSQLSPYLSLMTQEEKEQYDFILKQTEQTAVLKSEIAGQVEIWENINNKIQIFDKNLLTNLSDVNKISQGINEINKVVRTLETLKLPSISDNLHGMAKVNSEWKKLSNILSDPSLGININLQKLEARFKKISAETSLENKIKIIIQELKDLGISTNEIVKLDTKMKHAASTADSLKNSLLEGLSTKQLISGISNTVGAIGQLATSLSMISNIVNIVFNDNISGIDRFTQIVMNSIFSLSILSSSFQKLGSAVSTFMITQEGVTAIEEAHVASQTAAIALNEVDVASLEQLEKEMYDIIAADELYYLDQEKNNKVNANASAIREINNKLLQKEITTKREAALMSQRSIINAIKEFIAIKQGTSALQIYNKELTEEQIKENEAAIAAITHKVAVLGVTAALAAAALVIGIVVKIREKYVEQIIEENKKELENIKTKEEKIKANQELLKSYQDLLAQQKKEGKVEDELIKKAFEVAQAYKLLGKTILTTAGYYQELENAAKAAALKESENNIKLANEGAKNAAETMGLQVSGGTKAGWVHQGVVDYKATPTWGVAGTAAMGALNPTQTFSALANLGAGYVGGARWMSGDTIKEAEKQGLGNGFQWRVDYTDPKAVAEYVKQVDYMVEYTERIGDSFGHKEFLRQKQALAETLPELEEQLDTFYTETTNVAFGTIDLAAEETTADVYRKIEEIKGNILASGEIPADEVDKYIDKYLSGISSIQEGLDKIDIAKTLGAGKTEDEIADIIADLNEYNTSELAYLSIHLNTELLDEDYKTWIDKHEPIISLLGEQGASNIFKNTLSNFDDKKGFSDDTITSLFTKDSATSAFLPSKEEFLLSDISTQYDLVTQAMIKSTQAAVEHKDKVIEMLDIEKTRLEGLQDGYDEEKESAETNITALTEGNKKLKDDYEDIYQLAVHLAEGEDKVSDSDKALLSQIENLKVANQDELKLWGQQIIKAEENEKAIHELEEERKRANNLTVDHKKNIEELNKTLSLQSSVMDSIQSAYSTLEKAVDDYNEKGHWTVDNIQKIIELDDKYIATLDLTSDKVSIGEEAFQKLAIAKLEDMRASVMDTAYEKLETIALKDTGETALLAAEAVIQAAIATGELTDAATNSLPALEALNSKLAEISNKFGANSLETKAAENIIQAAKNVSLMIDDSISAIKEGGDSMKNVLHTGKDNKSGSKKKDKDEKLYQEEFDRYHDLKKAIDAVDRAINKLDKDQENLYGKELIRSLKEENVLLEQQTEHYKQLAEAQRAEAAELQGILGGYGVTFDATGAILNYAEATVAALKTYNDAVAQYNAGLLDESAFEIYEKNYEKFKKYLERYDTLFYQEMQETQEKLDEIRRKELANNLKAWEVEVKLKLDWQELKRGWNDFLKDISTDFKKVFKDLNVEVKNMFKDAQTYIGKEGTIGTIISAVKDVTKEIDKMMNGGESDMFESVSQAQEKLKELNDQLQDSAKALHDLWEEAWDAYLEGIDQAKDKFDNLMDRFERIDNELEFQGKLIELLYGDEAYGMMSKLYEGQLKSTDAQIDSLKQQADMWKRLFDESGATMENQSEWNEDQQKYYENWLEAQDSLNDKVIEYIELLQKDYLNTIKDILKELENAVTGSSLDNIATEWERISADADKYYDNVEGAYHIQTLANKMDQDIAKTTSLKAQQKLMDLREKEINYLREKKDLTEYDIKAAELRYQAALKEIALEDAQQNKTAMKLTRNEQGNWSYQYVAEEEDIITKRQELLDTYNELYQLASDAYEKNLESLQQLNQTYFEKLAEIEELSLTNKEEADTQRAALDEWYFDQYEKLSTENTLLRDDLATSSAALLLELYEQDTENYEAMTDTEKELIQSLKEAGIEDYQRLREAVQNNYKDIGDTAKQVMSDTRKDWNSGAQEIANKWNGDNGSSVRVQVTKAYDSIMAANTKYQNAVDACAEKVGRDFDNIEEAIQDAEDAVDSLKDATTELVNQSESDLNNLRNYVNKIEDAWKSVQQSIRDAISLIEEYLRKVGEANAAAQQQAAAAAAQQAATQASDKNGSKNGSSTKKSSDYYTDPYGVSGTKMVIDENGNKTIVGGYTPSTKPTYDTVEFTNMYKSTLGAIPQEQSKNANSYYNSGNYSSSSTGWNELVKEVKKLFTGSYATGGYTGEWDDSGRLAMLHQKELVLNADDTKNFLSGISMIRQLSSGLNGSIENAVLKAVANTALSLGGMSSNPSLGGTISNNNSTDNVFNITAEFPNANDVNEIREAILSLPNLASQYIHSNLK